MYFFLFMLRVCNAVFFVHSILVITSVDLLVLLFVMFSCVFVTFPCGVFGQGIGFLSLPSSSLCSVNFIQTLFPLKYI